MVVQLIRHAEWSTHGYIPFHHLQPAVLRLCCTCMQVMVRCLQQLEGRVVGVVGLAHLDGMQRRWDAWQRWPRKQQLMSGGV